jgi:hypothetical protein
MACFNIGHHLTFASTTNALEGHQYYDQEPLGRLGEQLPGALNIYYCGTMRPSNPCPSSVLNCHRPGNTSKTTEAVHTVCDNIVTIGTTTKMLVLESL